MPLEEKRGPGRPKKENPRGIGKPVRIPEELWNKANIIAAYQRSNPGAVIATLVSVALDREYNKVVAKLKGGGE